MARVDLTDFSGGIREVVSPADFTERQSSVLRGFVLEDEVRLRSQGPIQQVTTSTSVRNVRAFRGAITDYLVFTYGAGLVGWCVAPSPTATNATTSALTITQFANITANSRYRFTTEFTYRRNNEIIQGLIISALPATLGNTFVTPLDTPSAVIYESANGTLAADVFDETAAYPTNSKAVTAMELLTAGTGYTSPPTVTFTGGGGSGAVAEATIANGKVTGFNLKKGGTGYTTAPTVGFTGGGGSGATAFSVIDTSPLKGKLPRHNVAGVWDDTLVLADIQWSAANAETGLNSGNVRRYSNYAWLTYADALDPDTLRFDPTGPERLAPEGAVIVGLQPVPEGLLVLTTAASGGAGLTLLRGTPSDFEVEVLRPGLGMMPGTDLTTQTGHTFWNEVASTMFVDSLGKLYQVRGVQVERIDRYGPEAPEVGNANNAVAAIGSWLFMHRNSRMLVLRSFGEDGAWSELVLPPGEVRSLTTLGDSLYFVAGQTAYRYCIAGPDAERGLVAGQQVDLTIGTRVLGNPDESTEKWWDGLTVRTQGRNGAQLRSVRLLAGSPLEQTSPAEAAFTLNRTLDERDLVSVPGLGPSVECSAVLVFQGDVRVENLSFEVSGGGELL